MKVAVRSTATATASEEAGRRRRALCLPGYFVCASLACAQKNRPKREKPPTTRHRTFFSQTRKQRRDIVRSYRDPDPLSPTNSAERRRWPTTLRTWSRMVRINDLDRRSQTRYEMRFCVLLSLLQLLSNFGGTHSLQHYSHTYFQRPPSFRPPSPSSIAS